MVCGKTISDTPPLLFLFHASSFNETLEMKNATALQTIICDIFLVVSSWFVVFSV